MKILVVDDEKHIRESLKRILELEGMTADTAEDGPSAQLLFMDTIYDLVIMDLRMPGMDGHQLLGWMSREGILTPVLMISAHGDIHDAVEALKNGAKDYIVKPFEPDELVYKIRETVANRRKEELLEISRRTSGGGWKLVGEGVVINSLREQIARISGVSSTVLITGESGSGKEVAAREIHARAANADEPFVAVNVGSLPENLVESELFGYEKGAFTGAEGRKPGLFELAGKGTLFLDEIGEMPQAIQVKLLRVLQERRIRRLGGTRDIPVESRIISATNRTLEELVKEGRFREDLFYRLNVVRLVVPPLRDRLEDIPLLSDHLLSILTKRMGIAGVQISSEALSRLSSYSFPGNVRELENLLERGLIYCNNGLIGAEDIDLPDSSRSTAVSLNETPLQVPEKPAESAASLKDIERGAIETALKRWNGNRTRAARELGISRRTIIYKIKEYALNL